MERCNSVFKPSERELFRCRLPKGHAGSHESSWEWEDDNIGAQIEEKEESTCQSSN